MTIKFGKFDPATGDFQTEFTPGGTCNFGALAAIFETSAPASTGLAGATAVTTAGGVLAGSGTTAGTLAAVGGGSLAAPGLLASGGLFSGLSTFDLLNGSFSAFSAISNIAAGNAAGAASEEAALFEEFGAKGEILKGRREALAILEKEQDALEQNLVNTAASGITGQGSPKAAQDAIISKANFETGITRDNAVLNAAARRTKGRQLTIEAEGSRVGGVAAAAGDAAGFFLSRARRGSA